MSSKIQNKLYNYEQVPPESAWNRIASSLDANEDLSSKLYTAEITPPPGTWNKIKDALEHSSETAGKTGRIVPFLRYAAAAIIIGLVTWGGLQLINSNKSKTAIAVAKPAEEKVNNNIIPSPVIVAKTDEDRNDSALESSKKTYAKLDVPKKKRMVTASAFHAEAGLDAIPDADKITDRYIVLMTPDGNLIRMSKKLSNMVCCVSGEEQDADCRDQVERWRKQLACSSASHPGNFLDILDLVSSLRD
jgi:hypothetical protein